MEYLVIGLLIAFIILFLTRGTGRLQSVLDRLFEAVSVSLAGSHPSREESEDPSGDPGAPGAWPRRRRAWQP